MKKSILAALTLLASLTPFSASAAPADVSSTSNFTLTVVEATIGLTITGTTNIPEVISKTAGGTQEISFPNIAIQNSGNTKGVLYANTLNPTGIKWGSAEGDLLSVQLNGSSVTGIDATEKKLTDFMTSQNTDGDANFVGPKEKMTAFDVVWKAQGQLPVGELVVPIKWTMKAN
ncbi:hypothetical protein [Brevibacillus sp. 179-C9.3 HS]|uniref:hypothetical protein n=1 Tax=unclassified Brevibacillus TaxID=2684853 RepID=UPI0039A26979